jgi:hypothetical protein
MSLLRQVDDLYIPHDERTLRRLQKRVDRLDSTVRGWAQSVVRVLPRGLPCNEDELYILGLFLAQQRRVNLEIDAENLEDGILGRIGRVVPFRPPPEQECELNRAAHRTVAARLESDIDRAVAFFCQDRGVPPMSDPAIDWRVSIRYLAQELHRLAGGMDVRRDYYASPERFEIALVAREAAHNIAERRRAMLAAFSPFPSVPSEPLNL